MKLYATTTSERASKSQGGNDFLDIKLIVGDKSNQIEVGIVRLQTVEGGYLLALDRSSNFTDEAGRVYEEFLKAEKKKAEWTCGYCGTKFPLLPHSQSCPNCGDTVG